MDAFDGREMPDGSNGSKRRKRTITDARKEQNRVAQRTYRQRRRETRQSSLRQSSSLPRRCRELKPSQVRAIEENLSQSIDATLAPEAESPLPSVDSRCMPQLTFAQSDEVYSRELFPLSVAVNSPVVSNLMDSSMMSNTAICDSTHSRGSFSDIGAHEDLGYINPAIFTSLDVPWTNDDALATLNTPDPGVTPDTAIPGEFTLQNTLLEELPMNFSSFPTPSQNCTRHMTNSPSRVFTNPDTHDDPTTGASVKQWLELEEVVSAGLDILLSRRRQARSLETLADFQLPDPHMNNIHVSRSSHFAAFLHNARCLGIQIPDLFKPSYNSPFYRQTTASDDPNMLLAAASNATIPPHLQPTLPQILFPHYAFLDLLPFPLMRVRAITLAATPQTFDPRDLKRDIMHGGLVCWRRGRGMAEGNGQPWDMHSWEIAPWFRKKWRMLIE